MAAIRTIIAVAVVTALAQSGCSGINYAWPGRWRGNRDLRGVPGANPTIVYTAGLIDLILKDNGQFEMLDAGAPKSGSYRIDGSHAYLRIVTVFNRPIADQGKSAVDMNREIELTVKDRNTIVYRDPTGFEKRSFDLKRRTDL